MRVMCYGPEYRVEVEVAEFGTVYALMIKGKFVKFFSDWQDARAYYYQTR